MVFGGQPKSFASLFVSVVSLHLNCPMHKATVCVMDMLHAHRLSGMYDGEARYETSSGLVLALSSLTILHHRFRSEAMRSRLLRSPYADNKTTPPMRF
jgi:hypothetical protein